MIQWMSDSGASRGFQGSMAQPWQVGKGNQGIIKTASLLRPIKMPASQGMDNREKAGLGLRVRDVTWLCLMRRAINLSASSLRGK